jgi:hypothetical protein
MRFRGFRAALGFAGCVLGFALESCEREPSPSSKASGSAPLQAARAAVEGAAAEGAAAEAAALCHVLQGRPAERRSACCGSGSQRHFEKDCVRALTEALSDQRIAIDGSKLDGCREATERAFAGCAWVTPGQPLPPAECQGLTRGRVAAAGLCRSSLECAAPLHCQGNTPTQAGRCAPALPAGAACRAPADVLGSYLFARDLPRTQPVCAGACSFVTHRCENAEPSACQADADCPRGLGCSAGRCVSAPTSGQGRSGEACRTDFDCAVGGCTGSPGTCGMKCAASLADRERAAALQPLALPRRSPPPK